MNLRSEQSYADAVLGFVLTLLASFTWSANLPPHGPRETSGAELSLVHVGLAAAALVGIRCAVYGVSVTGRAIAGMLVGANGLTLVSVAYFAAHVSTPDDPTYDGGGFAQIGFVVALVALAALAVRRMLAVDRGRAGSEDGTGRQV